jgi:AraC-like DNA-binding protein
VRARPSNRPPISSLPFRHAVKPALGFDMFRLSSLYERGRRRALGNDLEAPQRPEFHTLYVGTHGRGEMIVDFTPTPLGAGTISIVARGRVQEFRPAAGVDAWMLLFTPEFIELPGRDDPLAMPSILWPLDQAPALHPSPAEHAAILQVVAQLEVEHARPLERFQPLILSALLRSILLRLERTVTWRSPMTALRRFFTILERDFASTREVAHYAREAGLSPRRLGELMHAELGRPTKQVIDERVILEQQRLLAHTAITVKELADRTGFAEATNLVKFFRLHVGQTPLAFRDASRAGAPRRGRAGDRRSSPYGRRS